MIGRLPDHSRFVATVDDPDLLALMVGDSDPVGTTVYARGTANQNFVALTRAALDARHPVPTVGFADEYQHLIVKRDGHVLEVTINRPEARNAIGPSARRVGEAVRRRLSLGSGGDA